MMEHIQRALVLAPHPDDGEFSSGGTLKKLSENGVAVFCTTFSPCKKSVPKDLPEDTLYNELKQAVKHLGIQPENLHTFDFPVRDFPKYRQEILETMVQLKKEIQPDLVLLPNSKDIHQDHQVIHAEGVRAFKHQRILGYELPWNSFSFNNDFYVKIEEKHMESKIKAIQEYKSQSFREYYSGELFRQLAGVRGIQINAPMAEAFELLRWFM